MFIVDAHLDLAYNTTRGRDVTLPAVEQPVTHNEIPTVGLPDLRAGGVGLVCATIFAEPASPTEPGYTNAEEARGSALLQLDWYRRQEGAGHMRFIRTPREVPSPESAPDAMTQNAILLLEGADPLRAPDDIAEWFAAGMRIVGLAWRQTHYAGGTGAPGPLTPAGIEMARALDDAGIIHDTSHLAEESFWQLLDVVGGPVIASHSNCRTIVPTDRQLSDGMIRAVIERGGVLGINFFDKFLLSPADVGARRATLGDVVRHVRHICDLAGNALHVGIGTDMDGGLGREQIPAEIATAADLPKLADALSKAGFDDASVLDIMGGNWLRYFRQNLAAG